MPYSNLEYLPIILGTMLPVTFIWTYIIAVLLRHIDPGLPYISSAGNQIPESCVFGQMLNICAALMSLCVYIRYRQLLSQTPPHRPPKKLLLAGLWTGWLASLGISIIANFQIEAVSIVHGAGAFLSFVVGVPYLWIQVACTTYDPPPQFSKQVVKTRIIFASLSTIFLLGFVVGFMVSNVMELLGMSVAMAMFVVTLSIEFQHITLTAPQAQIINEMPYGDLTTDGCDISSN